MRCLDSGSSKGPMNIDETLSRRLASVSFTCACLVVPIHIATVQPVGSLGWWATRFFYNTGITRVAVPLFFAISGFLLAGKMVEKGWWGDALRKRFRTVVLPYVIWNFAYWLLLFTLPFVANLFGQSFGGETLDGMGFSKAVRMFGLHGLDGPIHPHLWFLRDLYMFVLLSPFFLVLRKRFAWIILMVLVAFCLFATPWLPFVNVDDWKVTFNRSSFLTGFCYFGVGIYLRWHPILLKHRKTVGGFSMALGLALEIISLLPEGGAFGVISRVLSIPALMTGLWCFAPSCSLPRFLKGTAFPLYILHGFVIVFVYAVIRVLGLNKDAVEHSVVAYFVQWPVIVICSILISKILSWFPRVFRIAFGGRQ